MTDRPSGADDAPASRPRTKITRCKELHDTSTERANALRNLPGGQDGALEFGENEFPDLRRMIAVDQQLDPRLVLVGGAHRDEIGVRPLGIFAKDRILDRIEPR